MANKIQIRRGLKSKLPTLSSGELAYTTDTRETFVGTGSGNVNMGGSHWYRGTAMSGTSTTTGYYSYSACPQVKVDDMYLNTSNGNVYACTTAGSGTSAMWTYQGSIKGDNGPAGADGGGSIELVSDVDFNNITEAGFYSIPYTATNVSNAPTTAAGNGNLDATLIVTDCTSSAGIQICKIEMDENIYIREVYSGRWSNWRKIQTEAI